MTALREEEETDADGRGQGRFGLRPVSYLPLQRYVIGVDPIHISNSLAVHGQGVFVGGCVGVFFYAHPIDRSSIDQTDHRTYKPPPHTHNLPNSNPQ